MASVPTSTIDVTAGFLTEALQSTGVLGPDTVVAEVEHDRIGEGVGLMCSLARLTLRYRGPAVGAPSSVVLKVPSEIPENRAVASAFRFYEREGRFYEHLGPDVAVRAPACLFNHLDPVADTYLLVLEDFGSRTMVSQLGGIDVERASEAVRAVAALHAQWWDTPMVRDVDWMPTGVDPEVISAGERYRQAWPAFVELLGDDLPAGAVALGERVGPAWEATQTSLHERAPMTICHGDFRADNLMFDDSATGRDHVGVLDWQLTFRSGGISDVAYLVTQSMTEEDRRAHDRHLVEVWYEALGAALGRSPEGYSLEDAWDGYRACTGTMTVYAVVGGGQLDPSNERGRELIHDMAVRAFSAAVDLDAADLITP